MEKVETPVDGRGKPFKVGQQVARAKMIGNWGAYVTIAEVTKVDAGRVYLDGSGVAMKEPDRLVIVNVD